MGHEGRDWAKANEGVTGIQVVNEAIKVDEITQKNKEERRTKERNPMSNNI